MNSNVFRRLLLLAAVGAGGTGAVGCDTEETDAPIPSPGATGAADDPAADPALLDPATCDADGLRALLLPVHPEDPAGAQFTYFYQLRQGSDPDGPTVIFLPGGPGATSIDAPPPGVGDVNLVLTDPRGVGCNAYASPHEADFYGTDRFASDVLAIVGDLDLQDYVVYGHSYGTVLGTVVASRATAEGLPAPRLVILEGIFGPAIENDDAAYAELWLRVRDALPKPVQAQLLAEDPPLGLSRLQWGEFITATLSQLAPAVLFDLLSGLGEDQDPTELKATVEAFTGGPPQWEDETLMSLFRSVACQELAENSWFGFELVDGEVVPSVNACASIKLQTPYDPADWPIEAPILYVEGDRDPATTPEGARAHFDAQAGTDRTFVSIHGVGHVPLQWYVAGQCGSDLFAAALANTSLSATLEACGVEATVDVAPAD